MDFYLTDTVIYDGEEVNLKYALSSGITYDIYTKLQMNGIKKDSDKLYNLVLSFYDNLSKEGRVLFLEDYTQFIDIKNFKA